MLSQPKKKGCFQKLRLDYQSHNLIYVVFSYVFNLDTVFLIISEQMYRKKNFGKVRWTMICIDTLENTKKNQKYVYQKYVILQILVKKSLIKW